MGNGHAGSYEPPEDDRSIAHHRARALGHLINANLKENGVETGIEATEAYK